MRTTTSVRLKQTMSERNLKQVDILNMSKPFQKKLNIKMSKSHLSQYVNGKSSPDQKKLYLLSLSLGVNEAWLMGYDVPKERTDQTEDDSSTHLYNYFETFFAMGALSPVNAFTSEDVRKIRLPDESMGRYAGRKDIFLARINGDSMNNVMPDNSVIAVCQFESIFDLKDRDIVVFRNGEDFSVKRFFNDAENQRLIFRPDSNNASFTDIIYPYEEQNQIEFYGKIVLYMVQL